MFLPVLVPMIPNNSSPVTAETVRIPVPHSQEKDPGVDFLCGLSLFFQSNLIVGVSSVTERDQTQRVFWVGLMNCALVQ
jgi:hypothetical protein